MSTRRIVVPAPVATLLAYDEKPVVIDHRFINHVIWRGFRGPLNRTDFGRLSIGEYQMNRTKTAGAAAILGVAALLMSSAANATPVKWTLDGITFSDNGVATGSFVFDADTGIYSGINITTSGGSLLPGATYTSYDIFSTPRDFGFGSNVAGFTATGDFLFDINGLTAFTNAGGTVQVGDIGGFVSSEGTCANDGCHNFNPIRGITSGQVDGVAVPEPATWAMMLAGFGGLGAMMRRRRARTALATT
ncbi:MAG TPA: PEPxxWA-CTERM sorting domain-containing protein [Phenylobacterium sp.]|jgi:hypothetical protein|nr:PEPxxWA-CTERM sorting domain-containing protein [Phenylobacterium sp.]